MEEKIFYAASFSEGLSDTIRRINARSVNLGIRHILIVPDKYTLDAETRLFADNTGAFDVEVLTFARLFYRICDNKDYLGRAGAIMMIRGICENISLECYKKSARFSGFAEKVYDTVNALLDAGLDIENAVAKKSAAAAKLKDIMTVYHEYQKRTENKFIDRDGRLRLLAGAVTGSEYVVKSHFYITNFMDFTGGERRVIESLKNSALSVSRTLTAEQQPKIYAESIETYDCAGNVAAFKAVARRIRSAVIDGMRYKDICVALSETVIAEAERIFSEYGIAFYTDRSYPLDEHPFSCYIMGILGLIERKYRRCDMVEISKNIYCGVKKSDSDCFENFVAEYNIDYLSFLSPFDAATYGERGSDKQLSNKENRAEKNVGRLFEGAERARKTIIDRILPLEKKYKKIRTAKDFAAFIREIMDGAKGISEDFNSSGKHVSDAREKIEETLALMEKILTEEPHRATFLHEIFGEGLASGKILAIPNLSDSVLIGKPSVFRGQSYKYVFILGMNEGEIPSPNADRGLFNNDGEEIEGFSFTVGNENIIELNHLLAAAEKRIFISYDSMSENGISNYLKGFLISEGDKIFKNSLALEEARLSEGKSEFIKEFCCEGAGATELLISNISEFKKFGHICDYNSALYAALKDSNIDRYFVKERECEHVDLRELHFPVQSISVSRLQEYFACPYAHFIKYGLRAKVRKESELLPMDIGNILHLTVENFVRERHRWDDADGLCKEILDKVLERSPRIKFKIRDEMYRLLLSESVKVCGILKSHFSLGRFECMGQEISLSGDSLKPLIISAAGYNLRLIGSVDYADHYKDKVRIVDYKTGRAEFSFSDIYYGRKIQLPLYMQAFISSGYQPAGFFFFPFSLKWTDSVSSHRFKGVFDGSIDIVTAMDSSVSDGGNSNVIPIRTIVKDGTTVLYGRHDYALSKEQLSGLCEYSKRVAEVAATEIIEGYIAARPYKNGKKCACDYCEYTAVCGRKEENIREQFIVKSCQITGTKSGYLK